mgnify:CR=1 FL=1
MLESIINSTKVELGKKLSENGISEDQLDSVIGLAQNTVMDNFRSYASSGDLNDILSLFNGKQSIQASSSVNNIIADYAGQLIAKLGFNESTAKSVAGIAIPFIMKMINKQTPDTGLDDKDINSLLGSTGLDDVQNGILGKFKNLF